MLQGGITGQDSSRGNPFPQSAIAEYKVITQNYKAELDQISSAAVVAVTRSGTNEFRGDAFWDHSRSAWRARHRPSTPTGSKISSHENQFGASLGGPIIPDRMHWFLAYEGKSIHTPRSVTRRTGPHAWPTCRPPLQGLVGSADAPFHEDLLFGKLGWSIDDRNLLELTLKVRDEKEVAELGERNTRAVVDVQEERRDAAGSQVPAQQRTTGSTTRTSRSRTRTSAGGRAPSSPATCSPHPTPGR